MPKVAIIDLADDDARRAALTMALSMYLGEACKYCGFRYETVSDLHARDVVFAGYHERGRIACKTCWDANNPASEEAA